MQPYQRNLYVMGLGYSVKTQSELTAKVVVVRDFNELEMKKNEVMYHIVLKHYNIILLTVASGHRNPPATIFGPIL